MTRRQTEWRERVARWRASGLTGAEFARIEGVREGTLRHWAWDLGRRHGGVARVATPSAFVEVVAPALATRALEIVVRDDMRIRVPVDFDEPTLRRVLAIVETR